MRIAIVVARSLRGTGFATRVAAMLRHYKGVGFEVDVYHFRQKHELPLNQEEASLLDRYVDIEVRSHSVRCHLAAEPPLAWNVARASVRLRGTYDVVQAETTATWPAALRFDASRRIVVLHDDDAARLESLAALSTSRIARASTQLSAMKYSRWQYRVLRRCDEAWFVSEQERVRLTTSLPNLAVRTIPNGAGDEFWSVSPPSTAASVCLFVGPGNYAANRSGLDWFVNMVWPTVQERVPGARLRVVGSGWNRRDADSVTYSGFVRSLVPEYEAATVVVAPLFGGGGTKMKVVEGMASSRPVVATSWAAAGIAGSAGLRVCDDPEPFAHAVTGYLADRSRAVDAGLANRDAVADLRWSVIWQGAVDALSQTPTSEEVW